MKITETYEWNYVHSTDIATIETTQEENDVDIIETTPEYFAKMLANEENVQKVSETLEKFGISVKTKYGNYRPLYDVLSDIGERWEQLKDSFLRGESMEKFVKLTTSESGDWQILEVDGVEWASGHSISADDWLGLISEHFGGMIDRATISDEEMELRC